MLPPEAQAHDHMKRKRDSALIPTRPLTARESQTLWLATVTALLEAGKPPEETVASAAASKGNKRPTTAPVPTKGSAAAAAQSLAAERQNAAVALHKHKLDKLVQQLHMLLIHDEEAAKVVMIAIGALPYDQLQTIEVTHYSYCGCCAHKAASLYGTLLCCHRMPGTHQHLSTSDLAACRESWTRWAPSCCRTSSASQLSNTTDPFVRCALSTHSDCMQSNMCVFICLALLSMLQ